MQIIGNDYTGKTFRLEWPCRLWNSTAFKIDLQRGDAASGRFFQGSGITVDRQYRMSERSQKPRMPSSAASQIQHFALRDQ